MSMPALFVGHGSPMNAIEDNPFSRAWRELGQRLPRPEAILCVSAHWLTEGTALTAMAAPRTIHDFYGFPDELYRVSYPAPGAPDLARQVAASLQSAASLRAASLRGASGRRGEVRLDADPSDGWGLDHGTWSVLRRMYPQADVPTIQLSLDYSLSAGEHYALGRELRPLREEGVLIVGSGNAVHNLGQMRPGAEPFGWAIAFDEWVRDRARAGDHQALAGYLSASQRGELGPRGRLAHPTADHYWPLLYALAVQDAGEPLSFFNEEIVYGSVSMRGVVIGDRSL